MNYNENAVVVVPPWGRPASAHEMCAKAGCTRMVGSRPRKCALCNT